MASASSSAPPRLLEKKSPLLVFAHTVLGDLKPFEAEWMMRWKEMIVRELHAVEVVTFDYPYFGSILNRDFPKFGDLVDVLKESVSRHPGHPLILVGRYMGSWYSCMAAGAEDTPVSAIICLGYLLESPDGTLRDEPLLKLSVPTMFVRGSRQRCCPLDKLIAVRRKMKCITKLHVVDEGDQLSTEAAERAVKAIAKFVQNYCLL